MIKLNRSGLAPLEFNGEVLAQVSTENLRGDKQMRWWEIGLYMLPQPNKWHDKIVAHIGYRTRWKGEVDSDWSESFESVEEASEELSQRDPIPARIGWPPRKEYETRQKILIDDLLAQYDWAVSKVLEEFPEVLK
jgi:hypothetical protein